MKVDDVLELEEMDESITKSLIFHKAEHSDFSFSIEPDYEKKELIIKTLYLDEQQN